MNVNLVDKQKYHNIEIETKSISFKFKNSINDDKLWKQFIIYSFLSLYKINTNKEYLNKLLNGELKYITYQEFNKLIHNALVEMNFMLDDISESQYRALNDFLFNNKNIIGKCYTTSKPKCKQKLNSLNKKL